jgi:hypothetical protein
MNNIETMKLALEALEFNVGEIGFTEIEKKALTALRQTIEQAQQAEPVAWMNKHGACMSAVFKEVDETASQYTTPLYTSPPPRQPLTHLEIWNTYKNLWMFHPAEEPRLAGDVLKFARAIEAAHGIKG